MRPSRARALFGSPRLTAAQLVELVVGVASGAGAAVDQNGRNFIALLAENRRLGLLGEIAAQYEALRADVENTIDVEVTTAMALTDEQRATFSTALSTCANVSTPPLASAGNNRPSF